jgi:hypothetical protein
VYTDGARIIPHKRKIGNVSKKIEYNPDTRAMTVTFKGGKRYNYNGVPPAIWDQAVNASSIGSYLSSNIKGIYPFTPL